jgi:23S rRNA (uridine2552-2'-O)-methyltransferase
MAHPGRKDPFRVKAKEEGYPARSVYKLIEIQKKFKLIQPGHRIVDLGCHPGSWLKFCSQTVGSEGLVLGLDLKDPTIPLSPNITFIKADLLIVPIEQIKESACQADVVLSDLSPKTCGIKWLDHQHCLELNRRALEIGFHILTKRGSAVFKFFEGEGTAGFVKTMKGRFDRVHIYKPKSSRRESPEIYLVGLGFKG